MKKGEVVYSWDDAGLISLQEVKDNLRVDHADDDTAIQTMVEAAYTSVESHLNRVLLNQTVTYYVASDSSSFDVRINEPEALPNFTNVKALDKQGNTHEAQTFEKKYTNHLIEIKNIEFSTTVDVSSYILTVVYTPKLINKAINQAVLLTVNNYYDNRNSVVVGTVASELPLGAEYLLTKFKLGVI